MVDNVKIAPLIHEETTQVETLLRLLDEELEALANRDAEGLESLAWEKRRLVLALETLGRERRHLMGPMASEEDWTSAPARADVRPAWNRLTSLVEVARQNNRRNGTAIDAANRYTRRAVDVLFGQRESDAVYGASGERKRLTNHRYSSTA